MWPFRTKKQIVAAELAGNNITAVLLDADDCWRDVCDLRSYETSGSVATCEMAFARAGLLHRVFLDSQTIDIGHRMVAASLKFVESAFADQDTDETRRFYDARLVFVASQRISLYSENAFPNAQLASILGAELQVPGIPSVEIAPMFDEVERRTLKILSTIKIK